MLYTLIIMWDQYPEIFVYFLKSQIIVNYEKSQILIID